nr:stage IV sporulation protein A [Oscillospiraceae bacterium]
MADNSIYRDIAKRTGGDIYVGVVGPVRTGKSTFIHRFIDSVVLPNIEDEYDKKRTLDEMPQSASGRTIMTTEPKFVPDESVRISLGDGTEFNIKLIDCVGYMTEGALGGEEDGSLRMVMTPWSKEAMPFTEAAELGTSKVIGEHSTIGMLVTTDGTICDIPRASYIKAEERVAGELKALGKPFAIVLNSAEPESEEAHALAADLEEKYGAPVALVSCHKINADDIREILSLVLGEFPVRTLSFALPDWVTALPDEHRITRGIMDKITAVSDRVRKLGDIEAAVSAVEGVETSLINAGEGEAELSLPLPKSEYYATISELSGIDIKSEGDLLSVIRELADVKRKYEKVASALADVEEKGYG